jgi:hypothetical protein
MMTFAIVFVGFCRQWPKEPLAEAKKTKKFGRGPKWVVETPLIGDCTRRNFCFDFGVTVLPF